MTRSTSPEASLPKTGPHSFTDATGVEWFIEGYSKACGAAYVDCRSADGKALTVRPVAYLAPAGLSIPEGAEPPKRPATDSEKKAAHEQAERIVGHPIEKPQKKQAKAKGERKRCKKCRKNPGIEQFPDGSNFNADGLCPACVRGLSQLDLEAVAAYGNDPSAEGGGSEDCREAHREGLRAESEVGAQVIPFPIKAMEPITAEQVEGARNLAGEIQAQLAVEHAKRALTAGRFVLYVPQADGTSAYVTSWDTWEDAHTAFPIPEGYVLSDDATGNEWKGPCECECGNCSHEKYGCLVCGNKGTCTPTVCKVSVEKNSGSPERVNVEKITLPGVDKARVVNKHRDSYDVDIGRPGPWGNPYSHRPDTSAQHIVATREQAIDLYRDWLRLRVKSGEPGLVEALASLHGKRLGCYCAPQACHGSVLADAAEWAYNKIQQKHL